MSTANFKFLAQALAVHFAGMSAGELFRTAVDGDHLWEQYLTAFPEGTNPIYRVRTEHDGSYDRSFIRKLGNVVRINADGTLTTIWDLQNLPYPYNVVCEHMSAVVKTGEVDNLFRIKEPKVGVVSNMEDKDGVVTQYNHFHADIAKRHVTKDVGEVCGNAATTVQVLRRGVTELKPEAIEAVLEMIEQGNLYRGAEFKSALERFQELQNIFRTELPEALISIQLWRNYDNPVARLRNSVIGTLLQDLSDGVDLEKAVKAYEVKVAPANYKRPTALITQGMIDKAMDTIDSLGLRPSLERRFAVIGDVSVNDVLWVDNSVQGLMRDGLRDLLSNEVKPAAVDPTKASPIAIDEFLTKVMPRAAALEVYFSNQHRTNLASLTAPVHADAPALFKWGNGFAWSYNGNIADSEMRKAVVAKGGRVDGVFRFTHQWNYDKRNASLMDLHVLMPGNTTEPKQAEGHSARYGNSERVGWNNRNHRASGGVQDVDYVSAAPVGYVPVENITFPDINKMPEGLYRCYIHNWRFRSPTEGGFKAEIEFGGQVFEYEHARPLKGGEFVHVANVTLKNGVFTIDHKIPHGAASHTVWGVQTERFVKVNTVLRSPNHWDGKQVGNKHWFFILEGCQNDEPTRGIYNEFLKPELEQHRKVFEVLGNKTKCQPSATQLSGLGFSSTKRDSVLIKVTDSSSSTRLYQVNF